MTFEEAYQKGIHYERYRWLRWTGQWPGFTEYLVLPWLQKRLNKEMKEIGLKARVLEVCRCGHLNTLHKTECAMSHCDCAAFTKKK